MLTWGVALNPMRRFAAYTRGVGVSSTSGLVEEELPLPDGRRAMTSTITATAAIMTANMIIGLGIA